MNLKIQKYLVALFLFIVNLIFSTTSLIYENDWYAFIFVLGMASLINTFSVLFIVGHKLITKDIEVNRIESKNYIYVIPCYNESEDELTKSLNSLVIQRNVKNDKRSILIICDGIATGKNNSISTDKIIKKLLCINSNEIGEYYDYKET